MCHSFQEKYKDCVFQILKICNIRTLERFAILILIRQLEKNINRVVQLFQNKVGEMFSLTSQIEKQINLLTYLFIFLFLLKIEN